MIFRETGCQCGAGDERMDRQYLIVKKYVDVDTPPIQK